MSAQSEMFGEPPPTAPVVLVSDPPWLFDDDLPGEQRGASKHYACMTVRELCLMPIPRVGRNAVLFLWRVAAMQPEAFEVARAWDFEIRSELVWQKTTKRGKRFFGMGHYTRMEHEVCLIGVRGSASPAVRNVRSIFAAPVGPHSAKPARFYELVREMYPQSRLVEMFARTIRAGWQQYGLELGKLGSEEACAPISA